MTEKRRNTRVTELRTEGLVLVVSRNEELCVAGQSRPGCTPLPAGGLGDSCFYPQRAGLSEAGPCSPHPLAILDDADALWLPFQQNPKGLTQPRGLPAPSPGPLSVGMQHPRSSNPDTLPQVGSLQTRGPGPAPQKPCRLYLGTDGHSGAKGSGCAVRRTWNLSSDIWRGPSLCGRSFPSVRRGQTLCSALGSGKARTQA